MLTVILARVMLARLFTIKLLPFGLLLVLRYSDGNLLCTAREATGVMFQESICLLQEIYLINFFVHLVLLVFLLCFGLLMQYGLLFAQATYTFIRLE